MCLWVCTYVVGMYTCRYVYGRYVHASMTVHIYAYIMYVSRHEFIIHLYIQTYITYMHAYTHLFIYACVYLYPDMYWHTVFVFMYINKHILDI